MDYCHGAAILKLKLEDTKSMYEIVWDLFVFFVIHDN